MAAWHGAQALLPTKSAPKAHDMANKTSGNRRNIDGYDIAVRSPAGTRCDGCRAIGSALGEASIPARAPLVSSIGSIHFQKNFHHDHGRSAGTGRAEECWNISYVFVCNERPLMAQAVNAIHYQSI
jgi:hypothetical protein